MGKRSNVDSRRIEFVGGLWDGEWHSVERSALTYEIARHEIPSTVLNKSQNPPLEVSLLIGIYRLAGWFIGKFSDLKGLDVQEVFTWEGEEFR